MTALSFTPGVPHPRSPGEQCLYVAFEQGRLSGRWQFNQTRHGCYVDLVNDDARTIVEVDGYTYHSDQQAFTRDRARDRMLGRSGWTVHRFTSSEVLTNMTAVIAEINDLAQRNTVTAALRRHVDDLARDAANASPHMSSLAAQASPDDNPRRRVYRLVRQISTYLANRTTRTAGDWAIRINSAVKNLYGPADQRDTDKHNAAYVFLINWWKEFRDSHNITDADLPDPDAPPCVICHQHIPTPSIGITATDGIICSPCLNYVADGITQPPVGCHHCHTPITLTNLNQWTVDAYFRFACPNCCDDAMHCRNDCDSKFPGHYTLNDEGPALCAECMENEFGDVTFSGMCDLHCGTTVEDILVDGYYFRHFAPGEWTGDIANQPHHMWVCRRCLP